MDKQKMTALLLRRALKQKVDYFNKNNGMGRKLSFYALLAKMVNANSEDEIKRAIRFVNLQIEMAKQQILNH